MFFFQAEDGIRDGHVTGVQTCALPIFQQLGGIAVTASDSSGYVVDESGIDLALLKQIKEVERGRISEYADRRGRGARFIEGGSVWDVPVAIALPGAIRSEEHTSELQSRGHLVCRLLLEKK